MSDLPEIVGLNAYELGQIMASVHSSPGKISEQLQDKLSATANGIYEKDKYDDCIDWERFHKDLDIAMAHIINEAKAGSPKKNYFPSRITGIKLAEYAQEMVRKNKEVADGPTDQSH